MPYFYIKSSNDDLQHHGVQGQRWGVRRFQNEDGSYTSAGKKRYGYKGTGKTKYQLREELRGMEANEQNKLIKKYKFGEKLIEQAKQIRAAKVVNGISDKDLDTLIDNEVSTKFDRLINKINNETTKNAGKSFSKKYGEEIYSDVIKSRERIKKGERIAKIAASIVVPVATVAMMGAAVIAPVKK